jgi:hypothetical protein
MLEDLKPPSPNKGSCKVGVVAETLSEGDRKILLTAVADRDNWPIKTLARALAEKGLQLSDSPLSNHRAKSCACFR